MTRTVGLEAGMDSDRSNRMLRKKSENQIRKSPRRNLYPLEMGAAGTGERSEEGKLVTSDAVVSEGFTRQAVSLGASASA